MIFHMDQTKCLMVLKQIVLWFWNRLSDGSETDCLIVLKQIVAKIRLFVE